MNYMNQNKESAFNIMDTGILNDSIEGYLAKTMLMSGYGKDDVASTIAGLQNALDMMSAEEAAEYANKYKWLYSK